MIKILGIVVLFILILFWLGLGFVVSIVVLKGYIKNKIHSANLEKRINLKKY